MDSKDNRQANILCGISLACELAPMILRPLISLFTSSLMAPDAGGIRTLSAMLGTLYGILFIAGIVLLIIVRVKYPKNTFGKVLMWIYIVLGVIALILFIAAIVICTAAFNSCVDSCRGLGWIHG